MNKILPQKLVKKTIENIVIVKIAQMGNNVVDEHTERCVNFTYRTINNMQSIYSILLSIALVYLNSIQYIRYGKAFNKLSRNEQSLIINGWEKSYIDPKRKIMLLFSNLTAIAYFDSKNEFKNYELSWDDYINMQCFYDSGKQSI